MFDCGFCGIDRHPCHSPEEMRRRAGLGDGDCAAALAEYLRIKPTDCRPEVLAVACEIERRLRAGEAADLSPFAPSTD